jgi:methionyl-tRNA formyltransferase
VRVAFAGTPEFAVPSLHALLALPLELVCVFTQPDRPAGRGRELKPSAVKGAAMAAGIPISQPPTLKSAEAQDALRALNLDLLVVVAYGLILPKAVLDAPRFGCWNVHGSLLPRWRGAAPIQRAVEAGDAETGVALMQMDEGLDTGGVITEARLLLDPAWTAADLHDRLSPLGAQLLQDQVHALLSGEPIHAQPQPTVGVSYAKKLLKEEGALDFSTSALELQRKIKAFNPSPVCNAVIGDTPLKIYDAVALPTADHGQAPGSVIKAGHGELIIATGNGLLQLLEVQRAGGKRLAVKDFLNAKPSI